MEPRVEFRGMTDRERAIPDPTSVIKGSYSYRVLSVQSDDINPQLWSHYRS